MTVVLGVEFEGHVYIGADSITLNGWDKDIIANKKVFRVGNDLLIGFAGHTRIHNIIEHLFLPPLRKTETNFSYVVRVVDAIRVLVKDSGALIGENGQDGLDGSSFLIGYCGELYWVGYQFDVSHFRDGMGGVGVASDFAVGAMRGFQKMAAVKGYTLSPARVKGMMIDALTIAGEFSAGVAPPYYVLGL
jgi:ATP-dependent protease HslVU (ClpYQ) peptidase subunit